VGWARYQGRLDGGMVGWREARRAAGGEKRGAGGELLYRRLPIMQAPLTTLAKPRTTHAEHPNVAATPTGGA
jgi:hypothetical protein